LSLAGLSLDVSPAIAAPDELIWSSVDIPDEGEAGNWVLARDSDIKHLAMAGDGTIYCYANPSGTSYTLFKSAGDYSGWSYTGGVTDEIVDIAIASDDAGVIYYATGSDVYKSSDAGGSFTTLPASPGGAGTSNITIRCVDVARVDGNSIVIVGTADNNGLQYGGVYTLDESQAIPAWQDTGLGSYDVCGVAFSPDYATDRQMVAVVTDEQDTIVTARSGSDSWGQLTGNATINGIAPMSAAIGFPDDYIADTEGCALYIAVDTGSGGGDAYRINGKLAPDGSIATDLNIAAGYGLGSVDITGLAVSGNTAAVSLLVGAADSSQVYISTDSGNSWTRSTKEPTGQSGTFLLMSPDFISSGKAYAATSGVDSAFSSTTDGGVTWNQVGLIDAGISGNGILDLAVYPEYSQDGTLFMLTFDGIHTEYSLWRSLNGGVKWERVLASTLAGVESLELVELSPGYGGGSQVVFLAGISGGSPAIWKSADNGQHFICRSAPLPVDTWKAVNDTTLLLGGYDGSDGIVYITTDSGLLYTAGVVVGSQPLKSIALSPNYEQDGAILIGNTGGWVYYSSDNGDSFEPLPLGAVSPPLNGAVTVAFDPKFNVNSTVYAASSSEDEGVHRIVIGGSSGCESIDSTLPDEGKLCQLAVSASGVLYAANLQSVNTAEQKGGIERSPEPVNGSSAAFETVTYGLEDGVTLSGLWVRGNQLWSLDTTNTRIMTYIDSLALPVTLISPPYKALHTGIQKVLLEWTAINGAT
ncbi:hypothetical protein ACFLW0_07665, partial [Chloroflexota bacterium]